MGAAFLIALAIMGFSTVVYDIITPGEFATWDFGFIGLFTFLLVRGLQGLQKPAPTQNTIQKGEHDA